MNDKDFDKQIQLKACEFASVRRGYPMPDKGSVADGALWAFNAYQNSSKDGRPEIIASFSAGARFAASVILQTIREQVGDFQNASIAGIVKVKPIANPKSVEINLMELSSQPRAERSILTLQSLYHLCNAYSRQDVKLRMENKVPGIEEEELILMQKIAMSRVKARHPEITEGSPEWGGLVNNVMAELLDTLETI